MSSNNFFENFAEVEHFQDSNLDTLQQAANNAANKLAQAQAQASQDQDQAQDQAQDNKSSGNLDGICETIQEAANQCANRSYENSNDLAVSGEEPAMDGGGDEQDMGGGGDEPEVVGGFQSGDEPATQPVMEGFQSGEDTSSDMNLFLRGALYACLFYLLSHQDTLRFVSKNIKQLNMANAHLAMAAVFVLCYVVLAKYL
jgi:hypothetical protein